MTNRTKRTDTREQKFLDVLRATCNVTEAAKAADVGRRTVYEWRDADASFREEWDDAEQEAADRLEREAWRRAVEGVEKPVTFQGQITDRYLEYSDRMLELLLKAHRPEKFKERVANEHTGKGGEAIALKAEGMSDFEAARRIAFILAKATTDEEPGQ